MKCPKCQIEMESGFTWINASSPSTIEWAKEKPSLSRWKLRKGDVKHWNVNIRNELGQNVKTGHQCRACSLLVVEETNMKNRGSSKCPTEP
jgi:hypothetical protein